MKKMTRHIISAVALLLMFAACSKENIQIDEVTRVNATLEQTTTETKTTLGDKVGNVRSVNWVLNDEVAVINAYGGDYAKFKVVTVNTDGSAALEGSFVGKKGYYALYPAADYSTRNYQSGSIPFVIHQNQKYVAGNIDGKYMPMVAQTGSSLKTLSFKNAYGVLRLKMKGSAKVSKIEVKADHVLSGVFQASIGFGIKIIPSGSSAGNKNVILDCGEGVQLTSAVTEFNIVLPPTPAEAATPLTVVITYDGNKTLEKTLPNKPQAKITRSHVTTMAEIVLGEEKPAEPEYIDEYGINQGKGVKIGGVNWAPVNCGYHAEKFKWGKLYQWGRKDGHGFGGWTGEPVPVINNDPVKPDTKLDANTFYTKWNADVAPKGTWGGADGMTRTASDPCPEGWRVPNMDELRALKGDFADLSAGSTWWKDNDFKGRVFGKNHATATKENFRAQGCILLFATGDRSANGNAPSYARGNQTEYWSSIMHKDGKASYTIRISSMAVMESDPTIGNSAFLAAGHPVRCVSVK